MKKLLSTLSILFLFSCYVFSQQQPIEMPSKKDYRFQYRIKGPSYKKSEVLELMVDKYGNYLVATFRGEKSSFVYLYIYNLYTWEEKYKIKLNDNRCELYNSEFDESGEFFYININVYKNRYREINLKTGEIRDIDCTETPQGCKKLEVEFYKLDAYTIGEAYYIYRDPEFNNYIKVLVKKEMYIPKSKEGDDNFSDFSPKTGGVVQLSPAQIRDLRAGIEIPYRGIPIFYDPNAIDTNGNKTEYKPEEDNYKIRLTSEDLTKLDKKASFLYDKFVVKLDIAAFEKEQAQQQGQ